MQRLKQWLDIAAAIAAVLLALAAFGSLYVIVNLVAIEGSETIGPFYIAAGPGLMLAACFFLFLAIRIRIRGG